MNKSLVPVKEQAEENARHWTRNQIELIKRTIAVGATDDELKLFLLTAERLGLDPFARQIHFVKRKRKNPKTNEYEEVGQILVGIDGFRAIAERTGKLSGIKRGVTYDEHGNLVGAWAEVYRSDWREPVREEVLFVEYCQRDKDGNPMGLWATMPAQQLKKCAEAMALRMAFPLVLSGVYAPEEMEQAYGGENGTHEQPAPKPSGEKPVTDKQIAKLHMLAKEKGIGEEGLDVLLEWKYGNPSAKNLTLSQASEAIDALSRWTPEQAKHAVEKARERIEARSSVREDQNPDASA